MSNRITKINHYQAKKVILRVGRLTRGKISNLQPEKSM
jgi:hypothetical protein